MVTFVIFYFNGEDMERLFPKATVKRWVDGDTVDLNVDLGFKVWSEQRFRLARINTPEKKEPGYQEAIVRSNALAPVGSSVVVNCLGYDRYGRWIAEVLNAQSVNVNQVLLDEGLAKPYVD